MINEIELNGVKYNIRCITHGDPKIFGTTSYNFEAEINGVFVPLKCHFNNELIQDLQALVALDPVEELVNIARVEITDELLALLNSEVSK